MGPRGPAGQPGAKGPLVRRILQYYLWAHNHEY